VDVCVCYGGRIKNLQQAFDGITGGLFAVFLLGKVKDAGY
jgi:hypothetical protein